VENTGAQRNSLSSTFVFTRVGYIEGGAMKSSLPDHPPEHWLKLAEEVRDEAVKIKNPTGQRELEAIAQGYERLAHHAAKRHSSIKATKREA
jgi:hypothetical protein